LRPPSAKTIEFKLKLGAKERKKMQNFYCSYFVLFWR